ncbi:MAG TPA: alpha/beta fold hydrolase [Kribbellaceae bacterium]|jgi:pimeloyl-ACP methyl ester carboxylesterase
MGGEHRLLLIHGLGATGRVWERWRDLLDERWPGRWDAPDLPGHGAAAPLPEYTFGSMAAGLAEGLDREASYTIVGHSLGGVIGLALAGGDYGITVESVTGVGIKVEWSPDELAKAQALARRPVTWFDSRDAAAERFLRVSGLTGMIGLDHECIDAGLVQDGDRWRLAMDPATFGVGAPDMPVLLKRSKAGVVLVRGEKDPMNTDGQLAVLTPRVVTLPGLGHNAHVEDPGAVLRLVGAHLR